MATLAGRFAGILSVTVGPDNEDALMEALANIDGLSLIADRGVSVPPSQERILCLDLTGADHPGIVRDVSRVLASQGVNIEDMSTAQVEAPISGGMLFVASGRLRCPKGVPIEELEAALEQLAADLIVDISLQADDG